MILRKPDLRPGTSVWGAISILALALLAACASPAPDRSGPAGDEASRGGTAVLGSISDVDSWNEYVSQQSFAGNLLRRIYLRLARESGRGIENPDDFEPLLAESWEFSDDGLSLTFTLREAVWSDGRPITAEDVRFTWLAQTSEAVPWVGAASKQRITDVEALDARHVRFRFDGPYPYRFADAVEGGILPAHLFGTIPFEEWVTHDWSQYRIGSGPFVLERHRPQQEIVLARNPRYYDESSPMLDRVVVRIVPDVLSLLTQLEAGELDYVEGIPPRDAHRVAKRAGSSLSIVPFDYPNYDFLGWNERRPPFDSADLRRALTLAIDRNALVEDLLFGFGQVSRAPVPSSWWGADPTIEPWPYDPAAARRILAGLGYGTVDENGERSPGRTLEIELLTNNGNRLRRDMLVKIQEQLGRVGVEVEVRPLEPKAMRQQVVSGDFDGFLGGWVFVGKVDLRSLLGSEYAPPNGLNVVHYRSSEFDGLLDELGRAADAAEMESPLSEIQRQFHEDQPYTLLYEAQRIAAHGPRLRDVVIDVPSDPLGRLERFRVATP